MQINFRLRQLAATLLALWLVLSQSLSALPPKTSVEHSFNLSPLETPQFNEQALSQGAQQFIWPYIPIRFIRHDLAAVSVYANFSLTISPLLRSIYAHLDHPW